MKILSFFFTLIFLFNLFTFSSFAQVTNPVGKSKVEVSATVGEFDINLSGYITPYASLVMTTTGSTSNTGSVGVSGFLRSTVADSNGYFYMTGVAIKRGFADFCLDAIDFERLGESYTCFSFPPADKSITMRDLFLPPTLGLQRTEIAEGTVAIAWGYSMPNALVTLYLGGKEAKIAKVLGASVDTDYSVKDLAYAGTGTVKLTVVANDKGFYKIPISDLKAGQYNLYAKAKLKEKDSLTPAKQVVLKAISGPGQFWAFLMDLLKRIIGFLTSIGLGPLWLAIPIIILIIILLIKLSSKHSKTNSSSEKKKNLSSGISWSKENKIPIFFFGKREKREEDYFEDWFVVLFFWFLMD